MKIYDMFADDINRSINGVIKVDQIKNEDVTEQELNEYVITKELKKHFINFFNYYVDAMSKPTADIGVWISGFFGSGKSHFLKMLSYLLANTEVKGVKTVERFRKKFDDDPGTFMTIDRATHVPTETILFNIDIAGPMNKNKTAVLRVFAKMFYNHLGFYGDDLRVALMEQYVDQQGKTEEFRRIYEEKKGQSWVDTRRAFAFNGKSIIPALMETLDMSQKDAEAWFHDKTEIDFSIEQLVGDMKAYLSRKPDDFRLLFMVDEVGQYVGTDTDMLLNLQSLVEKIGSECGGKIWVVCTGQEAIDEIIKVRSDEFSRIQARFKTRLSLSSSSVDEVIQKRILKKKADAAAKLETVYNQNDYVLKNLFAFSDSVMDIKGYSGPSEFAVNFPFVPYQFIIMQKVFAEIRKHGNSGKHLAGGERSMLSGFQETAQAISNKDEYALAPFYRFYDTVHTFLDGSIRRVIERCERAAENRNGIEERDVDVLKLLYMIRYIDDIPANLDNIVILMADDIRMDKIAERRNIRKSLERLQSQNYINRTGEVYNFLTDEEQDIQREIKNTDVDTSSIVKHIADIIFADIYTSRKYRYGRYDFSFDLLVDGISIGNVSEGMRLRFITVATDMSDKTELKLMTQSGGKEAIIVLADTPYYESIENAMKIRKYVKLRNVSQLPKSMQDIIRDQQEEATRYENSATTDLRKAIEHAEVYADGEHLSIKSLDAKDRINQALEYLVSHVYSELPLIDTGVDSDSDIIKILTEKEDKLTGVEHNKDALLKVEEYLEVQASRHLPTSMADIQARYQAIPYGWKEIDIAAVVARLMVKQRVSIKYSGQPIQPEDSNIVDMLRRKTMTGKTIISLRQLVENRKLRDAKDIVGEFFEVMDVPSDEDGLISFALENFNNLRTHYDNLIRRYENHTYPDKELLNDAIKELDIILNHKRDNIAFIDAIIKEEDYLFDIKERMQRVEDFFKNQVNLFDSAANLVKSLANDTSYLTVDKDASDALDKLNSIVTDHTDPKITYRRIPELNALMATVMSVHSKLLESKRHDTLDIIRTCINAVHDMAEGKDYCQSIVDQSDGFFGGKQQEVGSLESLALIDGLTPQIWQYKDNASRNIEYAIKKAEQKESSAPVDPVVITPVHNDTKKIKTVYRQILLPSMTLCDSNDVDRYVEAIKEKLMEMMEDCDGVSVK